MILRRRGDVLRALAEAAVDGELDETYANLVSLAADLVSDIDLERLDASDYAGTAPADYGQGDITRLRPVNISSIPMRNLQPLTPPVPVYPSRPAADGREGHCDVYFSVSPQGQPFDVRADCTHRDFIRAAETAVKKVRFAPKIHLGRALTVTGVVYPIEFKMEQ